MVAAAPYTKHVWWSASSFCPTLRPVGKADENSQSSSARNTPEFQLLARSFGARVRSVRHDLGLTQEELAERAGITANNLQLIENGSSNPTLASISALARSLKMPLSELFTAVEVKATRR